MNLFDWLVVACCCLMVLAVGITFARRSSRKGAAGFFAGGRAVPWWAIGLSNTATDSSGARLPHRMLRFSKPARCRRECPHDRMPRKEGAPGMPPWFQVAFCAIGPDPYVLKRDLYGPLRRDLDIITGKLRSKHP